MRLLRVAAPGRERLDIARGARLSAGGRGGESASPGQEREVGRPWLGLRDVQRRRGRLGSKQAALPGNLARPHSWKRRCHIL